MTTTQYHETADDALAAWDAGEPVFTVEMGGLGPSYEQAIHIAAFELIRDRVAWMPAQWPTTQDGYNAIYNVMDQVLRDNIIVANLGVSGAIASAAKALALRMIKDGWGNCLRKEPRDGIIQVQKWWPNAA